MKLFAYAYVSFFDNDPQLKTVLAEDTMDALKQVFFSTCAKADKQDLEKDWEQFSDPQDVVQYLMDGEIGISIPVAVEDLSDVSIIAPINPTVEEHTSAFSQDTKDPSLEHDAQTIVYELNYGGVTCLTADAIAAAKVYVALSMLAKNKFAHELNLDIKKQSSAQTSLYDSYDVTAVEDADWRRMSDLVDVGSDVYVAKDGSIDYIQISNDYASSGFNRVRLFIQYFKQTFSQCENKKLIAAVCILFTCPGVFMRMKSDNVEGAIEYVASAYRDVQEYI